MIGTGSQALPQAEAVVRVRPISRVVVYSRDPNEGEPSPPTPRARWASKSRPPIAPRIAWTRPDVLAVITNSAEPVVRGEWLLPECT